MLLAVAGLAPRAAAQQDPDTAAPAASPRQDPRLHPPITPRRAFITSLLVPGAGQSVLDRPTAGALFVTIEVVSIAMIRHSRASLRAARRTGADSIIVGFGPIVDGVSVPVRVPNPLAGELIESRQQQVEDWIALLIANHFLAGADAYVAAHLWEVPGRIEMRSLGSARRAVVLSLTW